MAHVRSAAAVENEADSAFPDLFDDSTSTVLMKLQAAIQVLENNQPPPKSKKGPWAACSFGVGTLALEIYAYFVAPNGNSDSTLRIYGETALRILNETLAHIENNTCGENFPVKNVCNNMDNTTVNPACVHSADRLCDEAKEMRYFFEGVISLALMVSTALILYSAYKIARKKQKKLVDVLSSVDHQTLQDGLDAVNLTVDPNATVNDTLRRLRKQHTQSESYTLRHQHSLLAASKQHKDYGSVNSAREDTRPPASDRRPR